MPCDILIPAYNHPDLLRNLLSSLEKNTNRALLGRILIGDDGSDSFTAKELDRMASATNLPVTVIRHPHTIGFGKNCARLFQESKSPYCILLNTDVLVPPGWLERMLAPFHSDTSVAVATPLSTNAANHTMDLLPGQTWMDLDKILAKRKPLFPHDCTAIGFCMAVDRAKLLEQNMPLFDSLFERGYGEDSDLHYRVIQKGYRSVVIDNLLVHHIGGSSFDSLPDAQAIRDRATALFRQRWGSMHDEAIRVFEEKVAPSLVSSVREKGIQLDCLLVLPTTNMRYGGVWLACTLAASMIASGKRVGVLNCAVEDPQKTRAFGFASWTDRADVEASVASIGCVIATGDATLRMADAIATAFHCPQAVLLQGMEVTFRSGRSVETFRHYQQQSHFLCVSEALEQYGALINPAADITPLRAGPDPLVFYPHDAVRRKKSIAIALNQTPEKGATHALEIGLLLRERGFTLTFFGWDTDAFHIPEDLGTVVQQTDRTTLAHLLSATEFLIDHSFSEGLGLLPLEAAFCGCIPILHPRGGSEYIFKEGENSLQLHGYARLREDLERIASLTNEEADGIRRNLELLRSQYGLLQALKKAEEAIAHIAARR